MKVHQFANENVVFTVKIQLEVKTITQKKKKCFIIFNVFYFFFFFFFFFLLAVQARPVTKIKPSLLSQKNLKILIIP
jgi:hypothetical protein